MSADPSRSAKRAQVATFTVIPAGSSIPLGQLGLFNVILWLAAFRQHLIRSARLLDIKPAGFLFACVHGAYDPATQTYPIHLHGLASGDWLAVIDGLRALRKYRPAHPFEDSDRANVPVWMSRGPLTNMPAPLTYVLKSYWPVRETRLDADGIRRAVSGQVQRMPGTGTLGIFAVPGRVAARRHGLADGRAGIAARPGEALICPSAIYSKCRTVGVIGVAVTHHSASK